MLVVEAPLCRVTCAATAGTGTPTGAATFCFIQAIEQYGPGVSYGQLLAHMDQILNPGGQNSSASLLGGLGSWGGGILGKVSWPKLWNLV